MANKVIVIAAVSQNGVYGEGEKIPWYIPEDIQHFKELTTGQMVIMGRSTWESIPSKYRPLPNRDNVVITSTPGFKAGGAKILTSVDQAIAAARTEKVFCIGGASIWYHAMQIADEAWITVVKKEYPITLGVTHCAPELLNPSAKWSRFSFHEMKMDKDRVGAVPAFTIVHWVRK